jgi:uncharacterized protein (DUF58 family)
MASDSTRYLRPDVLSQIGDLELRARYVVEGFVSGLHRSPYQGYSVEFAQHKEYVAGDDIRHLDWRVYGRTDRFYIKQFEEETNLRTHILLDCSGSMRYPDGGASRSRGAGGGERLSKFEYAATVAASLAFLLIHQQDAVGLMLFDDQVRVNLPPLSNRSHLKSITSQIDGARLEAPTEAKALFADVAAKLRRRSLVILISDLLAEAADVMQGLERMRYADHEVIVMHVLDHDERTFPFQDNTLFEGLETPDLQLTVDPQALRRSYLDALGAFISQIRGACLNSGIDYVGLSTRDTLDVALRSYLASRQHRVKAKS